MKSFLSGWLLASALVTFNFSDTNTETNYRPYISTNLAKVTMTEEIDIVEEKCDGSGWITHGDGHKTECPGCSACESDKPDPKPDPKPPEVTYTCKCNTSKTYCNCVAAYGKCGCKKIEVKKKDLEYSDESLEPLQVNPDEPKYRIYHLGAKWCDPCEKMKEQTWANKRVKEAIKSQDAKLFILDEARPEHKKYFLYYKVKSYPTVIFLDVEDLDSPIYRASGFMGATDMVKTITERLKDE